MQSVKYDYLGFYNHEVSVRKTTAFPPFTDIVRVLIADSDDARALESTRVIYERIQKLYLENKDKFRFFGCMKAPIKKLQNKFRYQIIMRIERQNSNLLDAIYLSSKEFNNRNTSVYMELNPNNLS
jgi:primosomal protein N' (replication factor Y)